MVAALTKTHALTRAPPGAPLPPPTPPPSPPPPHPPTPPPPPRFDKDALVELGCGGLLGVNAGQRRAPRA